MTPLPPQKDLLELLRYESETGLLYWRPRALSWFASKCQWRRWNTRYAGVEAFTATDTPGYRTGSICGRLYRAHRIIWKMQTGTDPSADIDHEDHNRQNNRWGNLRPATRAQNCQNQKMRCTNTSGIIGVHQDRHGKWRAQIMRDGKNCQLGLFGTREAAAAVRMQAQTELGYHENHGKAQT